MKGILINRVYNVLDRQGKLARRKIVNIICNLFIRLKLYFVTKVFLTVGQNNCGNKIPKMNHNSFFKSSHINII